MHVDAISGHLSTEDGSATASAHGGRAAEQLKGDATEQELEGKAAGAEQRQHLGHKKAKAT